MRIGNILLSCLCSLLACGAFGVQFNIRGKHLGAAAAAAVVSQVVHSCLEMWGVFSQAMCCFAAAAAVSAYAEIMARRLKAPVNMYLITGIIPLVPGGLTYYTMLSLVAGNSREFLDRGAEAFAEAGAVAMGIFAVSATFRIAYERKADKGRDSGRNPLPRI